MAQPLVVVDAFTAQPFHGNPAGVCLLAAPQPDAWMQSVAREVNHSETAFLLARRSVVSDKGIDDGYDLRWFTPGGEVDLCGHATLASAHYLWESGALLPDAQARFHTRSGLLTAERIASVDSLPGPSWIEMDFPAEPASACAAPGGLTDALGLESGAAPRFLGRNRMDFLVELESEAAVRSLRPDFARVRHLSEATGMRGVIVTAAGTDADIVSRCFYPRYGIDEDPVTGSAHCALAPYWMPRLQRQEIVAHQASQRGGWLRLRLAGNRVKLRGQAVTTLHGTLVS